MVSSRVMQLSYSPFTARLSDLLIITRLIWLLSYLRIKSMALEEQTSKQQQLKIPLTCCSRSLLKCVSEMKNGSFPTFN